MHKLFYLLLILFPLVNIQAQDSVTYVSEYNRADRMMDEDLYEEAFPILDSLYKVKPDKEVLYRRGVCYYNALEYSAVIEDMNEVIRLDSSYWLATYFRASANVGLQEYETALSDIEVLLAMNVTDEELKAQLLKDHIFLLEELEPDDLREKLCKDYTRLHQIDKSDIYYYNGLNCYCNTYPIATIPPNYIPVSVIRHDVNNFKLVMNVLKKGKYKWYNKKHAMNKSINVGTYVNLDMISEKNSMNIAIAEVTKIEGNVIELDIKYWTVRIDNDFYIYDLNGDDSDFLITW